MLHDVNTFRERTRTCKYRSKRKSCNGREKYKYPAIRESFKYKRKAAETNRRVEVRLLYMFGMFFFKNRPDIFRGRNHRINYCEFFFVRDIETHPGPPVFDPSKTLHRTAKVMS